MKGIGQGICVPGGFSPSRRLGIPHQGLGMHHQRPRWSTQLLGDVDDKQCYLHGHLGPPALLNHCQPRCREQGKVGLEDWTRMSGPNSP